jgi:glutamate N-acetyltransferase/amino-acid N-acetyltransferase
LVKTALFASDANWGRILAAVGRSNIAHLKADEVNIYLGGVCIVSRGELDEHSIDWSLLLGNFVTQIDWR